MEILKGQLPNSRMYKKGRIKSVKFLVVHYTGNRGDTALNNVKYFAGSPKRAASAHYFVDGSSIYTSVPETDTAYHCGGGLQGKHGHAWFGICTNSNSIGIEMCLLDKNGKIRSGTVNNCIELVRYLMGKYGIPIENVIRHWDVTGKECPGMFTGDNNALWNEFKSKLKEDDAMTQSERKEFEYLKEMVNLVGQDIAEIKNRLTAIEKENARQNNIINLVGQDIENLKKGV